MTLHVNLDGVRDAYRLCFVHAPWAYFTRLPLDRQWGDRWEGSPYQLYAGLPYYDTADQILKLAFDGPFLPPEAGRDGVARSVLEINNGAVPWLRIESFFDGTPLRIMAGATLHTFAQTVAEGGGNVYAPLGWDELPKLHGRHDPTANGPEA